LCPLVPTNHAHNAVEGGAVVGHEFARLAGHPAGTTKENTE
jgi:hypothetical protein